MHASTCSTTASILRRNSCVPSSSSCSTQSSSLRCLPFLKPRVPRQTSVRVNALFPFDQAWNPSTVDAQSIAPQIFAVSIFPYIGFLYHLTKTGKTPKLTLIGFYFLLAFVAATIPAGIYAKKVYGTSLANVDWLHGSAESLLTVTNLLVVLGLRQAIREEEQKKLEAKVGEASMQTMAKSQAAAPEMQSTTGAAKKE